MRRTKRGGARKPKVFLSFNGAFLLQMCEQMFEFVIGQNDQLLERRRP